MNITWILLGVIILAFGAFGAFVLPWIRTHVTTEQLTILHGIANTVVFAAEQIFGAKMGEDKLKYALSLAKKLLTTKGLTFDEDVVRAAIEAQVQQLTLNQKATEVPSNGEECDSNSEQ